MLHFLYKIEVVDIAGPDRSAQKYIFILAKDAISDLREFVGHLADLVQLTFGAELNVSALTWRRFFILCDFQNETDIVLSTKTHKWSYLNFFTFFSGDC